MESESGGGISTELIVASIGAVAAVLTLLITGWIAYMTYRLLKAPRTASHVREWFVFKDEHKQNSFHVSYLVEYFPIGAGCGVTDLGCRLFIGCRVFTILGRRFRLGGEEVDIQPTENTRESLNAEMPIGSSHESRHYSWESGPTDITGAPETIGGLAEVWAVLSDDSKVYATNAFKSLSVFLGN